jgi:hypothetical protein
MTGVLPVPEQSGAVCGTGLTRHAAAADGFSPAKAGDGDGFAVTHRSVEEPTRSRLGRHAVEQTPDPAIVQLIAAMDWRENPNRTSGNEGVPLQ